jgi:hypothetical protein
MSLIKVIFSVMYGGIVHILRRYRGVKPIIHNPPHGGCAGGRIGTRFLRPRGTSPLKGGQPRGIEMGPRASSA